jgi:hypothetical protein
MGARCSFVVHVLCAGLFACTVPRDGEVRLPDAAPPGEAGDLGAPPDVGAEKAVPTEPPVPASTDTSPARASAPSVVSITPVEGQPVLEKTPIVITFSEPMDEASAQAAFTPEIAPAQPPVFSWSADKKVLTVDPQLSYPSGADPASVRPLTYAFTIAPTAKSLTHEVLPRASSRSFTLKFRRIRTTHHFVQKSAAGEVLSGNLNIKKSGGPWLFLQVGTPSGVVTHAFLTVLIDTIPDGVDIESAVLHSELEEVTTDPFGKLGNLRVKEVRYTNALVQSVWQDPPIPEPSAILFPSTTPPVPKTKGSAVVTDAVKTDYTNRIHGKNRSQFRLYFDGPPVAEARNESVLLMREQTFLEVTYLIR